jgi:outer membrane protein assembly factor BamB
MRRTIGFGLLQLVIWPAIAAACGSSAKRPSAVNDRVFDSGCASPVAAHAAPTPAVGAEPPSWAVFQHDARHSSTSDVTGPTTGTVRWTHKLEGGIEQSPVVGSDGSIYVASNGGVLHALDPASGQDRWTFDGGGAYQDHFASGAALLPDGLIVWPGPRNTLFGLTAAGEQRWTLQFDSPLTAPALGPNDEVYQAETNGRLHALQVDGSGARELWVSDLGTHDTLSGSPAVGLDGTIYQTVGNRIVALRERPGGADVLWHFDISSGTEVSPAVGRNDVVLFGTNDNFEYGIDSSGGLLWQYARNSLSFSSPAVTDSGLAYFGDHNGFMNVVDSETGCLVTRYQSGGEVWTAPAIDNVGNVYFGTKSGHIEGFAFDGRKLFDVDAGTIVSSYPALTADGTLVIGSASGTLYAIHD